MSNNNQNPAPQENIGILSCLSILGAGTILGFGLGAAVLTYIHADIEQSYHDKGYRNIIINVNDTPEKSLLSAGFDIARTYHDNRPDTEGSFTILTNQQQRQPGLFSGQFQGASMFSYGGTTSDENGQTTPDTVEAEYERPSHQAYIVTPAP